ncbi:CdaR family transcriptional regulator [Peribacillus acanthi]|uniref:CdaR family transcriptional regulator n=1 Tax=Peribacillus acanthi TaxID=2171554 RepID=UPI000D3E4391|nr:sugar diacid recognition domain-containing protein [Peribacillus acanthi]
MLTTEIAKEIVEQTMIRLNRNINIMDNKGIIIASGDTKRIHQIHAGAIEVLRSGKPLIIQNRDLKHWKGSLPGINLPISFQGCIIGVIGITGNPKEIMEFGELVKMITEMMIHQSFLSTQLEWKQRLREVIFEEFLKEFPDQESIKQRLQLIGLDLQPPYQVALIDIGLNKLKKTEIIQLFENVFAEKPVLIGFIKANQLFILTSMLPEATLKQRLQPVVNLRNIVSRIGIGSSVQEQSQIRHSYLESLSALTLGKIDQILTTYTEVETKALLNQLDPRAKTQFQNRILGNLSDKLIDTLEHFFKSNLHIGECAKNTFIHRNSLIYRIKKIKELTGYDPQILQDAITLQFAIWIFDLNKKESHK